MSDIVFLGISISGAIMFVGVCILSGLQRIANAIQGPITLNHRDWKY